MLSESSSHTHLFNNALTLCCLLFSILQEPRVDVFQKFRRKRMFARPPSHSFVRVRKKDSFARARERDVEKPALLFWVPLGVIGAYSREQSLLKPRHEDRVEFEPFRCVHGHKRHRVCSFIKLILVALKRSFFEQALNPLRRRHTVKAHCEIHQFAHIFKTFPPLFGIFSEHFLHPASFRREARSEEHTSEL